MKQLQNLTFLADFNPYVRLTDGSLPPKELLFQSRYQDGSLRVTVQNHSTRHLAIREIVLYETSLPFAGITEKTRFYGEGFQMLTQYAGTVENPQVIGSYGTDWDFFHFPRNAYHRDHWTVYNYITFMPHTKQQDSLLFGFCSTHRFSGEFRFNKTHFEIVMNTEDIVLDRGESWELEELYAACGARDELISEMARRLNRNHPRMIWKGKMPSGWCSYYCLRPMTTEGLVRNAKAMAQRIPQLGMIQIDAGYSAPQADWLTPNPKMGGDMKTTCEQIRQQGVEAGGYLSPFMHDPSRYLPNQHPEWMVQDEDGHPTAKVGRKGYLILDGTNPDARAYILKTLKHFHDEWGIRYFKLDFIAYGAFQSGVRYNRKQTGVEAYRMLMKEICDMLGEDSFILACNAPMWPAIGLCHGNRVTNDIHREWKYIRQNAQELFWRNWQHDVLWYNDPDVIELQNLKLMRRMPDGTFDNPMTTMTQDEIEFHKAFAVACGGMILSGDLLDELTEENILVLKKLLENTGIAARFDDDTFQVGRTVRKDGSMLVELFNWEDSSRELEINLNNRYQVTDFWSEKVLEQDCAALRVVLPAHGGRVLLCHPVSC